MTSAYLSDTTYSLRTLNRRLHGFPSEATVHAEQSLTQSQELTVLAVSSNPATLQRVRALASSLGWTLFEASTLREVWAYFLNRTASVVLTDEHLPGGSWHEVYGETAGAVNAPAFIVLAPAASPSLRQSVQEAGGQDALALSVDNLELERTVLSAVRQQDRRSQRLALSATAR